MSCFWLAENQLVHHHCFDCSLPVGWGVAGSIKRSPQQTHFARWISHSTWEFNQQSSASRARSKEITPVSILLPRRSWAIFGMCLIPFVHIHPTRGNDSLIGRSVDDLPNTHSINHLAFFSTCLLDLCGV